MNSKKLVEILSNSPIIRFNEICRRVNKEKYAKQLVSRLVKNGKLKRVKKGVYTSCEDIFSIASNIYYPSYISFISASYRFGFTETIPIIIYIVVNKRHKPIKFEGYIIEFVCLKDVFGLHKQGRDKNTVFTADLEKLMIDSFLRPKYMGNFEEITNIFKNSGKVNEKKLRNYLNRTNSNKVYRQVGYLLEKYKKINIYGLFPIDKNYYDLNPFQKGKKIDNKWRLKI